MSGAGMFGKVPAFGDFISVGTGTPAYRDFEQWLEQSNDAMAERGILMGKDPLGFMTRHPDSGRLQVGILVGSVDSVGRTFPLGMFYEVEPSGMALGGVPHAMAMELSRLASIARKARDHHHEEIKESVRALPVPTEETLTIRSSAQMHRLCIPKAKILLDRVFGGEDGACYGAEVILRACELAPGRKHSTPLLLEAQVGTDIELMFLIEAVDALSGGVQPGTVMWEVRSRRVVLVLGKPDRYLLALMVGNGEADRLWPVRTDRAEVARRAREGLLDSVRELVDGAGTVSAKDFLDSMRAACKSSPQDDPVGPSKERQGRWQRRVP